MVKNRQVRNIKIKKMLPRALVILVIISGLVISILGMYFVGQQKISREEELKKDFSVRLVEVAGQVENGIRQSAEKVFEQIEGIEINPNNPSTVLETVKNVVMSHRMVQYPFLINSDNHFIFPFTGKPVAATLKTVDLQISDGGIAELYRKAQELEFREQLYTEAITFYLKCLGETPDISIDPYIYNCIGRCYYKLKKYSRALDFYTEILSYYPQISSKDRSLYFQVLRQTALSYHQKQDISTAVKYYLKLYEEIPRHQLLPDASTLVFFKNEALDYLNQYIRKNEPENRRFKHIKEIDRLGSASELDITLRWRYFDIEKYERDLTRDDPNNDQFRFLKLKELFAPGDQRAQFYRVIKNLDHWSSGDTPSLQLRTHYQTGSDKIYRIAFKKVSGISSASKPAFFGFLVPFDFIQKTIMPKILERNSDKANLKYIILNGNNRSNTLAAHSPFNHQLLSYNFRGFLARQQLVLAARGKNYFTKLVQKETRFIYILIICLMLTIILGIYFFHKYFARESELVRLKSEFVDSASHTLKTPLTRIRMLTEKLQLGWVKEGANRDEYFQTIIREADNLTDMINNMLDFSRIEAGKKTYLFQPVTLPQLLKTILEPFVNYLQNLGFQLDVRIDETLPVIQLDPEAIRLIVGNLIHNGIKYSEKRKIIDIKLYREKNSAVLEIGDRGIGVMQQDIPHIFEKFYRGRHRNNKSDEGSGLGLFLVKHAVTAHGGSISVYSKLGEGTTFIIFLPISTHDT